MTSRSRRSISEAGCVVGDWADAVDELAAARQNVSKDRVVNRIEEIRARSGNGWQHVACVALTH
ncbi:MAG: hypothetical protein HZA51_00105 [Planctomycetes bacterium]|nr:hypothetical protein [Planctomycetota bacterium]